jgi:hypothetical protein
MRHAKKFLFFFTGSASSVSGSTPGGIGGSTFYILGF